ncbi:MAG TPA: alpha/beta family hydrolase [Rhodoglobus sp.]|nr:alpha/beta family hydrolase [Rhodoglobus sp.]
MDFLVTGPHAGPTLVLAHGAGGAMDSPWLQQFASLLSDRGIRTARFEFAYMAARRQGLRRAAPKAELVLDEYRAAVAELPGPLVIGGKSYGGRVASMVADELGVAGLVCLGYPFHPPGKPQQTRTAHLAGLRTPTLICQGTRDVFGTVDDVAGYELSPSIRVHWLDDGDHDLSPRKGVTGRTKDQNLGEAADAVAAFVRSAAA